MIQSTIFLMHSGSALICLCQVRIIDPRVSKTWKLMVDGDWHMQSDAQVC